MGRRRSNSLKARLQVYYYNNFKCKDGLIRCECCADKTFINKSGQPYLEFHHLIPFSTDSGPDHYLNLFALCSNCHSKMHHLNHDLKADLYKKLLKNNHLKKSFTERVETLFSGGYLEAIHLDYLLQEQIINREVYECFMSRNLTTAA